MGSSLRDNYSTYAKKSYVSDIFESQVHIMGMLLKPGTGNGERGTGVWERVYSGFPHNFQKPRAPGHEFGEKKQLFLTITPVVIKFLSNLIYVSIFNECKKRSKEKGSEKHVLRPCLYGLGYPRQPSPSRQLYGAFIWSCEL